MNINNSIRQINTQIEQYSRTFSTESEEFADLEFHLSRLLGYPQVSKPGRSWRTYSVSKQFSYDPEAVTEALKLVQGENTAAMQAQSYYAALRDAEAPITQENVRLMARNLQWIRENREEIYKLLALEYGDDWEDSDTRKAWANSYTNAVDDLYAIFARDSEYRRDHYGNDAEDFIKNIDRIRQELKITEEQRRRYAREKRENTRTQRFTAEELRQRRDWLNKGRG